MLELMGVLAWRSFIIESTRWRMPEGESDVGAYIGVGFGMAVFAYALPGLALWSIASLAAVAGRLKGQWSLGSLQWWLGGPLIAEGLLRVARFLGH